MNDHEKNIATFIHLSTFSRFIIPFGNFIGPILLWITNKNTSEFVNHHGKQAINFQLSMLLYTIIIVSIALPFAIYNLLNGIEIIDFDGFQDFNLNILTWSPLLFLGIGLALLALIGFIIELILIIIASIKASEGILYKYPLTINFLK